MILVQPILDKFVWQQPLFPYYYTKIMVKKEKEEEKE